MYKPEHIGIILDGNRRYAKKAGLGVKRGHEAGAKKVEELLKWSKELNIKELTLYIFSIENFNRTKKEIEHLMSLFMQYFSKLEKESLKKDFKTKIKFIGRLDLFPVKVRNAAEKLMKSTQKNKSPVLNFAFGYGGRTEIVDAAKQIAKEVKQGKLTLSKVTEKLFLNKLYLKHEPDLIIRPGGETRTSNFLTYQSVYSEWYFTDKFWPEFTKKDFKTALESFNIRKRRFGT